MDRRNFLGAMIGGIAASAAVRTFPFRVFSFPKEVVVFQPNALTFAYQYEKVLPRISELMQRDHLLWDYIEKRNVDILVFGGA